MKFITLTIAAVGVAALPQTLQVPGTYTPCGALINNCCRMAPTTSGARFMECGVQLHAQSPVVLYGKEVVELGMKRCIARRRARHD
ncbi:hypothetical protein E5D57_001577 [Metarhizium anisopliae]|nr:hypothetical protein E5D57_001577 [Metarhizium anisopliae]